MQVHLLGVYPSSSSFCLKSRANGLPTFWHHRTNAAQEVRSLDQNAFMDLARIMYGSFLNCIEGLQAQNAIVISVLEAIRYVHLPQFQRAPLTFPCLSKPPNDQNAPRHCRPTGRSLRYPLLCRRNCQCTRRESDQRPERAAQGARPQEFLGAFQHQLGFRSEERGGVSEDDRGLERGCC